MINRKSQKNIKEAQKELQRFKDLLKKIELRPCYGDADLKQKENEIKMLEHDIYELEKETNKLVLFIERGGSK
jgi:cob(I)alamin adenosyltransferase